MNETKAKKKNQEIKNMVLEVCQFAGFVNHFSAAAHTT